MLLLDEGAGRRLLCMERIDRDHATCEVQGIAQGPELGDLVGRGAYVPLRDRQAVLMEKGRQQMHARPLGAAGSPQGFAIHRERLLWGRLGQEPRAEAAVEGLGVGALQHAAHGGLGGGLVAPGVRINPSADVFQLGLGQRRGELAEGEETAGAAPASATVSPVRERWRRPRRWRPSGRCPIW